MIGPEPYEIKYMMDSSAKKKFPLESMLQVGIKVICNGGVKIEFGDKQYFKVLFDPNGLSLAEKNTEETKNESFDLLNGCDEHNDLIKFTPEQLKEYTANVIETVFKKMINKTMLKNLDDVKDDITKEILNDLFVKFA